MLCSCKLASDVHKISTCVCEGKRGTWETSYHVLPKCKQDVIPAYTNSVQMYMILTFISHWRGMCGRQRDTDHTSDWGRIVTKCRWSGSKASLKCFIECAKGLAVIFSPDFFTGMTTNTQKQAFSRLPFWNYQTLTGGKERNFKNHQKTKDYSVHSIQFQGRIDTQDECAQSTLKTTLWNRRALTGGNYRIDEKHKNTKNDSGAK